VRSTPRRPNRKAAPGLRWVGPNGLATMSRSKPSLRPIIEPPPLLDRLYLGSDGRAAGDGSHSTARFCSWKTGPGRTPPGARRARARRRNRRRPGKGDCCDEELDAFRIAGFLRGGSDRDPATETRRLARASLSCRLDFGDMRAVCRRESRDWPLGPRPYRRFPPSAISSSTGCKSGMRRGLVHMRTCR